LDHALELADPLELRVLLFELAVTRLRTCSGRVISLDCSSSTRRATSVPGITRTSTRVGPVCSKLWASGSETVREN
jgi:hypothetical protein